MFTDIFEEVGGLVAGHINSLPRLEELVGRLEAVAGKLEPILKLIDPAAAKVADQVQGDVKYAGQIAEAAITTAEQQRAAEAAASVQAAKIADTPVAEPAPAP